MERFWFWILHVEKKNKTQQPETRYLKQSFSSLHEVKTEKMALIILFCFCFFESLLAILQYRGPRVACRKI